MLGSLAGALRSSFSVVGRSLEKSEPTPVRSCFTPLLARTLPVGAELLDSTVFGVAEGSKLELGTEPGAWSELNAGGFAFLRGIGANATSMVNATNNTGSDNLSMGIACLH